MFKQVLNRAGGFRCQWQHAQHDLNLNGTAKVVGGVVAWKHPSGSTLKINEDAMFKDKRCTGLAIVARNSQGKCVSVVSTLFYD